MDILLWRTPFKASEDEEDDDEGLIHDDEQLLLKLPELKSVHENLRQDANTKIRRALIFLRIIVGLSCINQLLFNNLPNNPLAFHSSKESILSTPLRVIFNVSSFLIHYFLALNLSSQFRVYFYPFRDHTPVSYRFLYSISVLAPAMSLFFEIPWKIGIEWSYTPLVVFAVDIITKNIENIDREMEDIDRTVEDIDRRIANLEGMKYKAPGA